MIPFLGPIFAGIGGLASGAASLAGGAVSSIGGALGPTAGFLGETAIGAGGSVLSGIGKLAGGIFKTPAGFVSGAGKALFGGQVALEDVPDYGQEVEAGGGLFSNLSLDTLSNVAELGYSIYMTQEQMKLAEKALEAQRKAGYVVGAPGATLAPTTSIAVPAGTVAGQAPGLFKTEGKFLTYAIIAVIAYFILKGFK